MQGKGSKFWSQFVGGFGHLEEFTQKTAHSDLEAEEHSWQSVRMGCGLPCAFRTLWLPGEEAAQVMTRWGQDIGVKSWFLKGRQGVTSLHTDWQSSTKDSSWRWRVIPFGPCRKSHLEVESHSLQVCCLFLLTLSVLVTVKGIHSFPFLHLQRRRLGQPIWDCP
jgi:hypothetical protein